MAASKVVDADGHIMEPSDLWEKNLEPKYRDKAMRIVKDEDGLEYLEIEGKKSQVINGGGLGSLGGLDEVVGERLNVDFEPGVLDWEDCRPPGAKDPSARVKWMDDHAIDYSLIYPSLGLNWQNECLDPKLAAAYCRVYNDYITDFCKSYPDRLVPIASVSLMDVEGAVTEIQRAATLGAKGVYLFSVPTNGIAYGEQFYDPFWAQVQELDMPIGIHVSSTPKGAGHELYRGGYATNLWWFALMQSEDCQLAFTSFFQGAVFERFPRLKVGVVETGCGWIAHWLELMDAKYSLTTANTRKGWLQHRPSKYFERQCWITGEPDERTFPIMAQLMGAHKLLWGSDYPHPEGHGDPLEELKQTIGSIPEADQKKILGENALNLYNLA